MMECPLKMPWYMSWNYCTESAGNVDYVGACGIIISVKNHPMNQSETFSNKKWQLQFHSIIAIIIIIIAIVVIIIIILVVVVIVIIILVVVVVVVVVVIIILVVVAVIIIDIVKFLL